MIHTLADMLSPPCNCLREAFLPSPEKEAEPATIEYLNHLSDAPDLTLVTSILPIGLSDTIKAYLMLTLSH